MTKEVLRSQIVAYYYFDCLKKRRKKISQVHQNIAGMKVGHILQNHGYVYFRNQEICLYGFIIECLHNTPSE